MGCQWWFGSSRSPTPLGRVNAPAPVSTSTHHYLIR